LSSSCDAVKEARCRVEEAGGVITVSSSGVVERRGTECTADCGQMLARCESSGLPAGSYTLSHGDTSREITLPADAPYELGSDGFGCP
jgi:hypothetical protein